MMHQRLLEYNSTTKRRPRQGYGKTPRTGLVFVGNMDPMKSEDHPDGSLINIVSGKIAPASVNVDSAVKIGEEMLEEFEKSWP